MHLIENKTNTNKIMLIAETKSDMETLHYFFDKKVIRGLHQIYDKKGDKYKASDMAKFLQKNFPLAEGMGMINL